MERYEEYKDSGVEGIGKIPVGWEVKKLKYVLTEHSGNGFPDKEQGNKNASIPFYKVSDINGKDICINTSNNYVELEVAKKYNWNIVPKHSVITAKIGEALRKNHRKVSLVDCIIDNNCIAFEAKTIDYKFNYYLLFIIDFSWFVNPGTVPSLSVEKFKSFIAPIPSIEEQTAIVNFLDCKTAEIDALITQKEHLLELYKEEKTVIINHSVTKGIDPNTELKDSGVEWIGAIPVGWDVKKIKHSCYVKGRIGWKGLKSSEFLLEGFSYLVTGIDFKGGRVDWKGCYHIDKDRYEEDPYIQLQEHDLLITKDGTIGKLAIIDELDKPACLNSGIFVVRSTNRDFTTRYLYWVLMSNIFTQFNNYTSYGSTIRHLYQNVFAEFSFGFPAAEEQIAIANFLDRKTKEIDAKIARIQRIIELQKEYRTTLVSDVVMGKIKVSHLAGEAE